MDTKSQAQKQTITLQAIKFRQDGHNLFLASIEADLLDRFTKIDHFDPSIPTDDAEQGYQRKEEAPRVARLGNWLKKRVQSKTPILLPTALLASTRNTDVEFNQQNSTVTLNSRNPLHLVDGQHRRAGLLYAIRERKQEELKGFSVPIVIVEGLSKLEEMEQFAIVNGTQKGVRTDLVNMILTQRAAALGDEAIEPKHQWKVVVSRTVEALNAAEGSPWFEKILMPNETVSDSDDESDDSTASEKVVRATSFMTSLKPIYEYLNTSFFNVKGLTTEERAEELTAVIIELWSALRDLNPDAFATPEEFVIQKTPGLFAIHRVAKRLLPVMHMARRPWKAEEFRIMLEPCEMLSDPDYWEVKTGHAAKYGSMKGFTELAELIWANLQID